MSTPTKLTFDLIQHHDGYMEFRVTYQVGSDKWMVEGIGWLSEKRPNYYLRDLYLNNRQAGSKHYHQDALLVEQDSSLKFNHQVLEDLALVHIRKQLG